MKKKRGYHRIKLRREYDTSPMNPLRFRALYTTCWVAGARIARWRRNPISNLLEAETVHPEQGWRFLGAFPNQAKALEAVWRYHKASGTRPVPVKTKPVTTLARYETRSPESSRFPPYPVLEACQEFALSSLFPRFETP